MMRATTTLAAGIVLAGGSMLAAQTIGGARIGDSPDNYPTALPRRTEATLPALRFVEDARLDLGAAQGGGAISVDGNRVRVALDEGPAYFAVDESIRRLDARPAWTPEPAVGWVIGPDGRSRYRALPEGWIEMETKGRRRWKPRWSLRVAGGTPAPPLSIGVLLFFGSLDNQVYSVRADNGHELWRADLFGRVSWPLLPWQGTLRTGETEPIGAELVLAMPDDGSRLVALDSYDGRRAATLELPEGYALVPPARVLADGRVVALRQGYAEDDLSLVVYRLEPADSSATLVYNAEPTPSRGPGSVEGG